MLCVYSSYRHVLTYYVYIYVQFMCMYIFKTCTYIRTYIHKYICTYMGYTCVYVRTYVHVRFVCACALSTVIEFLPGPAVT